MRFVIVVVISKASWATPHACILHICARAYTHTYTHTHTCTHAHMHACTHTHTQYQQILSLLTRTPLPTHSPPSPFPPIRPAAHPEAAPLLPARAEATGTREAAGGGSLANHTHAPYPKTHPPTLPTQILAPWPRSEVE